ncbi:hypothetical protein JM18_001858 [Phytophthora kernoviae]|uniref:Mediator of RNA polymerase II transcription subunit 17 n=2 Tax=Phytophthora kernoviae TaxID=325452 RepID=A0A8T0M2Q1_9STRA|nr:hypothetical protein G195_005329 [Phytophthora kernoviae 00238/432]KAG2527682.1 hypothetical protein JM16_001545 [Phytophthora kernoviae]KAG2528992.1 hypothetical protein JM18_001858 [Phytophthora kernoviae]
MEEKGSDAVGVTLYPADYETVEMVTDQGKEILQQDFTDAQLFLHSIQELERVRTQRKKKQKIEETAVTEEAVEESSNGVKEEQVDESMETEKPSEEEQGATEEAEEEEEVIDPRIHYRPMVAELQAAVAELHQLINSIDLIRRRDFLEEMRCIRENTAPKREELEQLVEAKSAQVKECGTILMDGVEELAKTVEKESVFFQGITQMLRKWKICAPIHGNIPKPFRAGEPLAVDCSYDSAGSIFAPQTRSIAELAFAELNRTEKGLVRVKTPEDFLARTIQLKLEATGSGTEGNYTLPSPAVITMTKAEMDKLENTPEDQKILEERNVSQEIRTRHGRKEISRALLYTGSDVSASTGGGTNSGNSGAGSGAGGAVGLGPTSEIDKHDTAPGTLATVLAVLAHNLLKNEVSRYLDQVSSLLAFQKLQASASGRVLDDGLLQPICDSVRGVYVSPRWKTCAYDSTLSAFDLSIGKNFCTEVLISGARILLQTGASSQRQVSGVEGLCEYVETTVCSQVALALHRDALSYGLKQAAMNLDRTSVRLVVTGEWDGSSIGEGRVSDSRAVGSIFLEPYFSPDGSLAINCLLQAFDVTKLGPVQATLCRSATGEVHKVEWKRIPGASDAGKMLWLMQKTGVLSDTFKPSPKPKAAQLANGN